MRVMCFPKVVNISSRSDCSFVLKRFGCQRCTNLFPMASKVSSRRTRFRWVEGGTPRASGAFPSVRAMNSRQFLLPFELLHVVQHGTMFQMSSQNPDGMPRGFMKARKWSIATATPPQYTHFRCRLMHHLYNRISVSEVGRVGGMISRQLAAHKLCTARVNNGEHAIRCMRCDAFCFFPFSNFSVEHSHFQRLHFYTT